MEDKKLEAIGLIGSALTAMGNESRLEIVRYLKEEGKATFAEIRDQFDFNVNTVRFHLRKLMDAQLVEQTRTRGPYKLTEFGLVALDLVAAFQEDASMLFNLMDKKKAEA